MRSFALRALAALALPTAVLCAAQLFAARILALPPPLAGLTGYAPYLMLALGGLLSLAFNRGRALFALLALCLAYAVHGWLLNRGLAGFPARTAFAALCVFLPPMLGTLALLEERGAFNLRGARALALIALAAAFAAWVIAAGKTAVTDWAYAPLFEGAPALPSPIPQLGFAAIAAGLALALSGALAHRSAIEMGLAGAIVAFALAAHRAASADAFAIFIASGELIVAIAVLQDTFRLAFRDELTGLPSRRALNERLRALGRRYTVAMLDIDHFKHFNDTYGHAVGDQVLKMVAAHIARVGGGGKPFRYGGEEFTILFPRKDIAKAVPHLEAVRKEIAGYTMALRGPDRPRKAKPGKNWRGSRRAGNAVSVTISIGVAERSERHARPEDAIKAADKALYRAKNKGRNQVSR